MVLDQFLSRNCMVPFPEAHSHGIAFFGNQTYPNRLCMAHVDIMLFHSYRGTFTATSGHGDHESTPFFQNSMHHTRVQIGHGADLAVAASPCPFSFLRETGHTSKPSPVLRTFSNLTFTRTCLHLGTWGAVGSHPLPDSFP